MKHYQGVFDVYDSARIHLILCDDIPAARNQIKKIADLKDIDKCRGLAISSWPDYYIFLKESTISKRVIAHEIFHIVVQLMGAVGVSFRSENSEPFAYMIDWLTGWVYGKLGNRQIPTNRRKIPPTSCK